MNNIKDFVLEKVNKLPENYYEDYLIGEIVDSVKETYNIPCNYFLAGDYDSTGYDCWYYNIVWYVDGELDAVSVQIESY